MTKIKSQSYQNIFLNVKLSKVENITHNGVNGGKVDISGNKCLGSQTCKVKRKWVKSSEIMVMTMV